MNTLKTILKYLIIADDLDNRQTIMNFFIQLDKSNVSSQELINYIQSNKLDTATIDILNNLILLFSDIPLNFKEDDKQNDEYAQLRCFIIAEYYFHLTDYTKAIEQLVRCTQLPITKQNITVNLEIVYYRLIQSYIAISKLDLAKRVGLLYLQSNPHSELINKIVNKISHKFASVIKKPTISLCMIVKNEEEFLDGCLASVQGIVNEIIIVDTGSTDKTIEIAKEFNAKIYHFEWIDDFAAARNEALKHATCDWILYLDADERLILHDRSYIFKIINSLPNNIGAILCILESLHSKSDGSSEMHRGAYPRLFRNYGYPKIRFVGKIHEQITPSIQELGKEFVDSEIIIEHLGYNRNNEIIAKKVKRNFDLLLQLVQEEPLNGYAWFQLGQTLGRLHLTQQAINAIEFAIATNNLSKSLKASAYSTLSQFYGNSNNIEKCLDYAELSLSLSPKQQYATHLKAFALLHLKRYEEAITEFNKVLLFKNEGQDYTTTGFDIEIPIGLVYDGIKKAKEYISNEMGN